jgi:hypothetical protein
MVYAAAIHLGLLKYFLLDSSFMVREYAAFTEIEHAVSRTLNLLWPFRWGVWLRLALISFFVGAGGGFSPFQYRFSRDELPPGMMADAVSGIMQNLLLILIVVAAFIAVIIVFTLLSAAFQFVFVESLRSGTVAIVPYFRRWFSKGARLFVFQLGLTLILLAIIALLIAIFFLPLIAGGGLTGVRIIASLLALMLLIFIVAIPFGLIWLITIDFVVPIMVKEELGVLAAWRRCGSLLANQWRQAALYVIVKVLFSIGISIVLIILTLLALGVIAIPFVAVGLILLALLGGPVYVILIALLIPFIIIAIPVALLIRVPFETFFRHYSLLVLGTIGPEFALFPPSMHESIGASPPPA